MEHGNAPFLVIGKLNYMVAEAVALAVNWVFFLLELEAAVQVLKGFFA